MRSGGSVGGRSTRRAISARLRPRDVGPGWPGQRTEGGQLGNIKLYGGRGRSCRFCAGTSGGRRVVLPRTGGQICFRGESDLAGAWRGRVYSPPATRRAPIKPCPVIRCTPSSFCLPCAPWADHCPGPPGPLPPAVVPFRPLAFACRPCAPCASQSGSLKGHRCARANARAPSPIVSRTPAVPRSDTCETQQGAACFVRCTLGCKCAHGQPGVYARTGRRGRFHRAFWIAARKLGRAWCIRAPGSLSIPVLACARPNQPPIRDPIQTKTEGQGRFVCLTDSRTAELGCHTRITSGLRHPALRRLGRRTRTRTRTKNLLQTRFDLSFV